MLPSWIFLNCRGIRMTQQRCLAAVLGTCAVSPKMCGGDVSIQIFNKIVLCANHEVLISFNWQPIFCANTMRSANVKLNHKKWHGASRHASLLLEGKGVWCPSTVIRYVIKLENAVTKGARFSINRKWFPGSCSCLCCRLYCLLIVPALVIQLVSWKVELSK